MLQWLWERVDKREFARSIPQHDPQRMRALLDGSDSASGGDRMDIGILARSHVEDGDLSVSAARKALAIGDIGEGTFGYRCWIR